MRSKTIMLIGYGMFLIGAAGSIPLALLHRFLVVVAALVAGGGLMVALYARLCTRLDAANHPVDEAFDSGYEIGYDKGWRDGRAAERPKIVQLRRTT